MAYWSDRWLDVEAYAVVVGAVQGALTLAVLLLTFPSVPWLGWRRYAGLASRVATFSPTSTVFPGLSRRFLGLGLVFVTVLGRPRSGWVARS